MKIKISDDDFYQIWRSNSLRKAGELLNVGESCISRHAKKLGYTKRDKEPIQKLLPNVIVGGLPEE